MCSTFHAAIVGNKSRNMRQIKIKVKKHLKALDVENSDIADQIRKTGNHFQQSEEVKITGRKHHWKIRKLEDSAHMLEHGKLLSR